MRVKVVPEPVTTGTVLLVEKWAEMADLRAQIDRCLAQLAPLEELVIRLRFGLDDGISRTLREVGVICPRAHGGVGVTSERVRQIEAKALRRLRFRTRSLKLYLEEGLP